MVQLVCQDERTQQKEIVDLGLFLHEKAGLDQTEIFSHFGSIQDRCSGSSEEHCPLTSRKIRSKDRFPGLLVSHEALCASSGNRL
jgi:hypothetical protein